MPIQAYFINSGKVFNSALERDSARLEVRRVGFSGKVSGNGRDAEREEGNAPRGGGRQNDAGKGASKEGMMSAGK